MARAATTADAFNAVAEPRRREILDLLAGGERPVNDLVRASWDGPAAGVQAPAGAPGSGAVDVRDEGRQRIYRLNGEALKPIHDWVKNYEHTWTERFDRLDVVLDELKQKEEGDGGTGKRAEVTLPTDTDPDHAGVRCAQAPDLPGRGPRRSWSSAGGTRTAARPSPRSTCGSAGSGGG